MEPKIRLKGFSGKWEEKKFDSLAKIRRGLTYSPSNITVKGVRVLRSSNINEDTFVTSEDDVFVEETCVNIPLANDGDILITAANGSPRLVGKHAVVETKGSTMVPGGFMILAMTDEPYFLNTCMSSPWYKTFLKTGVAGGNGAIGNLNKTALVDSVFFIPSSKAERDLLASYFQHLDILIQSTTKKIESLKQVKAASLQSMFPQEGETTPRVRFKGFEGEWIKIKFAAFAEINRGLTYTPNNIVENGVRVLRSSNIDEDVFTISNEDVFVTPNCVNICYAKDGDILVTAANGSPRLVGKHAIIRNTGSIPVVAGGFMYLVTSQESEFLNASMSSNWYWSFIKIGVAGGNGSIGNLNRNDLEETVFPIPSLKEERDMIASYFTSLDSQITLQTQHLEKLKQIKSACLDNMFV